MDTTCDTCNDPRRVLYILLSGAEGGGPTARAAQQAGDEKLAECFRESQEEIVETAGKQLARTEPEREKNLSLFSQDPGEGVRVEFAVRAARRLETFTDHESRHAQLLSASQRLAVSLEPSALLQPIRDEAGAMAGRAAADPRGGDTCCEQPGTQTRS